MFHLFNRVYLDVDYRLKTEYDRVVISPTHGMDLDESLKDAFSGELIYNTTDFDTFFPDGWVRLLKKLRLSDRKVIIYCDGASYKKLIASWYRCIMPKMPYKIYRSVLHTQLLRESRQEEEAGDLVREPVPLGLPEKETMWFYRNSKPNEEAQKIIRAMWGNVSIEYHVLEFLKKGESRHLAAKIPMFVNRYFNELANEFRGHLILNAYSKQQQEYLGYCAKDIEYDGDIVGGMGRFPMLTGDKIKRSSKTLRHLTPDEVSELVAEIKELSTGYLGDHPNIVNNIFRAEGLINRTPENLTGEDVELFLDVVRESRMDTNILPYGDLNNINVSLIHLFLNLTQEELDKVVIF